MSEDASATYRGFRNQALYVLSRLLTDENASEQFYRPEGAEDLAVFNSEMRCIEVVQVKDYSSGLALSHFKPESQDGFFARLKRRGREHPDATTKLASFGPLGPEFAGAIEGDPKQKHRENFVRKLCGKNSTISASEAATLLDKLKGNVVYPVPEALRASVEDALRGTNVAADLASSVELLLFWVFDASEHKKGLSRQGLLAQLARIGSYLSTLRDESAEWGVSICQVKAVQPNQGEAARATVEYRRGVQARWEHILARADIARPARLQEIHRQLQHRSVVIIRGASGQGKSTLGWRYLHDYCAEGLRFHVRLVAGREHAMRIANAMGAHVRRLNLRALAYIDVSPADTGWSELVRELVAAGLKVLIAVREEDFRRANIAVGDFDFSEVVLDRVTREEAEPIFDSLRGPTVGPLDFEEAWSRFAAAEGGPLLEFTYSVTEGESLTSRIKAQISRIQNEAASGANGLSPAHLDLLALAAVANEAGARVSLVRLCEAVGISPLSGPLNVLEHEYLLRMVNEGSDTLVTGLHALRSKAVVKALFDTAPELWCKSALKVLPLIVDEDLESFLLAAFSRSPLHVDSICDGLRKLQLRSWTQAGCIIRSLLWEGVSRYERANQETILGLLAKYGEGWWLMCDAFVGMEGESFLGLLRTVNEVFKGDLKPVPLTPKSEVFTLFESWARAAGSPPPPTGPLDWVAAGDAGHWLGQRACFGPLRAALEGLFPSPLPCGLSIEELGKFISGRACIGDAHFLKWHASESGNITEKFIRETDSVHVTNDGVEVKVFFSVSLTDSSYDRQSGSHDWHGQTMKRVRLLRLLFPKHETFGSQGLGLELVTEFLPSDPTFKRIPATSLLPERSVRLNVIFGGLVDYRHRRPNQWSEYALAALTYREAVSACFRKLHRGWAKLLAEPVPRQNTIMSLPGAELDKLKELSHLPKFPRCALDEWGFLSEGKQEGKTETVETMQERSLRRFDVWRSEFRDFETGIGQVASLVLPLTVLLLVERKDNKPSSEIEKDAGRLLLNLASAWESLRPMQQEFRRHFGGLFQEERLNELESHERSNFRHLWAVAFAFRHERQRPRLNPGHTVEAELGRRRTRLIDTLKSEVCLAVGTSAKVTVRELPWILDGIPHLCIVCDCQDLAALESMPKRVIGAFSRAAQAGGWRPLEWRPFEIEWPKVALVNLVGGKAVIPAVAATPTTLFFSPVEPFEAKFYHYTGLPVRPEVFASGGFTVWESPLLRSSVALLENVEAFVLTHARAYRLVGLILEHDLGQADADRILGRFSRELSAVAKIAQRSYSELLEMLDATIDSEAKTRWKAELHRLCRSLLFELDENAATSLSLDTLAAWMGTFESDSVEFKALLSEVMAAGMHG